MSEKNCGWRWMLLAVSALVCWTSAYADIDKKLYKRAAERVWGLTEPQFDANADLSDSLYQNRSAVYIAVYTGLTAEYNGDGVRTLSSFTVDAPETRKVGGYTLMSAKPAFGARIIKPDGNVVDVDMTEALTVTSGKKGKKDEEYKVALAGIEPEYGNISITQNATMMRL